MAPRITTPKMMAIPGIIRRTILELALRLLLFADDPTHPDENRSGAAA